ncbi:uveal autoantigen with coiled-coil domains and ankyrin repeats [Lucilia sericata]|uniref:uveal autoantigen with coiled-coil domains and ankyrin repeats n=1 Tax=Lucilia sericata TaxID=13632 RepID=UPI0018A81711|nr:uveal autoantigen with coiled-coil domains and ankyrin repeats [Lucilia sericata]
MEPHKEFKENVADLTKIPPNEFEKYFQNWMERDDVARSLQAKLRSDLIKNFNKTNLGKHIMSHTMTSTGGSTMRLTLSPLVLALNTLVAEFLYAQNCHFTLSVFCTEVPFRNTLPDFESMRRFRFNNEEIVEIWQAVTGSKASKRDLNKHIIQNYETNQNMSLLLLIIKYLLKREAEDHVKRNAEVQTDKQEKENKSISAQVSDQEKKSAKDENLQHINQYLLTLSQKVVEMTREFEQFSKQRHESRSRTLKSARSREYYTLNKSLERITENMKAMAQAKRKNKRLSNIVESIDNLTQQFGKCAQNFDNVTKVLSSREEEKPIEEKPKRNKVKFKEKQTETELQEKTYGEWIHEMRNTENGQRFLNRVEISLRKALTKHREQMQSETDIKMKHLKSLMRLHYQQKLSKHLLQDPKINLEETRRCNDNIEKKLQQFEKKQMELLEKLKESSSELREAQQQRKDEKAISTEEEKIHVKGDTLKSIYVQGTVSLEIPPNSDIRSDNVQETPKPIENRKESSLSKPHSFSYEESQKSLERDVTKEDLEISNTIQKTEDPPILSKPDHETEDPVSLLKDVSKTQKEIVDMARTIVDQGRSVDHIIMILRIQQLENESNQLEQNFQSYLERRKRDQDQEGQSRKNYQENVSIQENQIISARLFKDHKRPHKLVDYVDEEIDEEFERLKETLRQGHEQIEKPKSSKSESSTSSLEVRNAILEAKLKFFEHENTIRKCREQGEEIRNGNLLQKHLEKYPEIYELPDYFNQNFGQGTSETNIQFSEKVNDHKERKQENLKSSLSEINIKDKTLDDDHDIELSPMLNPESQKMEDKAAASVRRELFPKHDEKVTLETTTRTKDLEHNLRYHEPIPMYSKDLEKALKGKLDLKEKPIRQTDTTAQLIKQSMAKMQQLFEQQSKSQDTLREMVNEITQERDLQREDKTFTNKYHLLERPSDALDKSLTTTVTSTNTATTITTQTSEERKERNHPQILENVVNLNRISNTSAPSMLNLSSESEDSFDSKQLEIEMTAETIKEIDEEELTKRETKEKEQIPLEHNELGQLSDSTETSELHPLPSPNKKYHQTDSQLPQEFGQIDDSPKMADLNLYSPVNGKEIGEILTESNRTFAPIDVELGDSTSTHSSSDLEISTGDQNKNAKNLADDSESDFWA